jgi:large subunit ribosomal protein L19e
MSDLKSQKRIAAQVLGIGESRVWVNPDAATDVAQAMTREDVRGLIEQGLIQEKPKKVQSRQRAKERLNLRRRRKGIGHGKRKGTSGGRKSQKSKWMDRVRAQRRFLQDIKSKKIIASGVYRKYYLRAKGGSYETLRQMKEAMRTDGVLKAVEKKK